MRLAIAITCVAVLTSACAHAGEKELLDKFKQQNNRARDRIEADIKNALEEAKTLEKEDPASALGLLQEVRDRMLQKGLLASREDRALAEPMWERIQLLRGVVRGKQLGELRASLAEFKEYQNRMNEQFAAVRAALIPPTAKEVPRGFPAFIAFANGKFAVGWVHEAPVFVVSATVNDQEFTYAPGVVAGLQAPQAFYVYQTDAQQFSRLTSAEFFAAAIASYGPVRQPGFWLPSKEIEPPPGYDKRGAGAVGLALFARSTALLMGMWTNPAGKPAESGKQRSTDMMRIYREAMIELQVQEVFTKLRPADQNRARDAIIAFLDRRPADRPLSAEEIVRLSDTVAELFAERRADAVAFAHLLNRFFERTLAEQKK